MLPRLVFKLSLSRPPISSSQSARSTDMSYHVIFNKNNCSASTAVLLSKSTELTLYTLARLKQTFI
uniref:Uncharacterized protein n=1 Tax=Rhinopithecus roxellana TaxID=61622 RepID=A0A2K6R6L5_RHIRO